jgi:hypothetical protein
MNTDYAHTIELCFEHTSFSFISITIIYRDATNAAYIWLRLSIDKVGKYFGFHFSLFLFQFALKIK